MAQKPRRGAAHAEWDDDNEEEESQEEEVRKPRTREAKREMCSDSTSCESHR